MSTIHYSPTLTRFNNGGQLTHGDSEAYTVTLEAGSSYMLRGVCDEDCLDLDLALYDGYGKLISHDLSLCGLLSNSLVLVHLFWFSPGLVEVDQALKGLLGVPVL